MKKYLYISIIALLFPITLFAKSDKRGVGENLFQYWAQLEALQPGLTWYYNWSDEEKSNVEGQDFLEYVPMTWGGNFNAEKIRQYCSNHPEVKYLLGFNEPNFKSQSNLSPEVAAAAWPEVQALAREFNLELVAPALNYSPDAPYNDPIKWMDEFVALVGPDAFDYTAIHAYGGFGVMSELATNFHDKYGKPVWVTEFCFWPGESGGVSVTSQINMMVQSLEWLEKTEWIHRYAWFKGTEKNSTNFNLVEPGKGEETRELSEQGKVYVYMSEFDPQVFHPVNTAIPAKEYINQSFISLGASQDPESDCPIEISVFNAGATLDYQFDVTAKGEYNLVIRVSGEGEPSRFNPNVGIVAVNSDGSDSNVLCVNRSFELSNDNSIYTNVIFPLNLEAGKQTIRVKDYAPYQPSGMRISTVTLAEAAGVREISTLETDESVSVYNLQGVCVLKNVKADKISTILGKGIYIINGKKFFVK